MARMHSGKKGKSGSSRPVRTEQPSWIRYKQPEIEMLISKMAKEGQTASNIGLHLRDAYGIPDVKKIIGKSITKFLKEKELLPEIPDDLLALIKRSAALRKHLEDNHKDEGAKRGLILTDSKIKRLVKYYKAKERLPSEWKLDFKNIRMYLS